MRSSGLLIALLLTLCHLVDAQKAISLEINHLLDGAPFANEVQVQNDLGNDYMINRLQYYLSSFSLVHDGGQVTTVDDLYVLVDLLHKAAPTTIELGSYDITHLEGVQYYFGIEEAVNHADPALWPPLHPLAPQFPSMHWGWAAGYRFIALEGKSGPALNQIMEFHCIGNEYYAPINLPIDVDITGDYTIQVSAEYNDLVSQIDISNGLILHGGFGEINTLARNIVEQVFTVPSATNVTDEEWSQHLVVYPNPARDGIVHIAVDKSGYRVLITDALGRSVRKFTSPSKEYVQLEQSGLYFVSLQDNRGLVLASKTILVP